MQPLVELKPKERDELLLAVEKGINEELMRRSLVLLQICWLVVVLRGKRKQRGEAEKEI